MSTKKRVYEIAKEEGLPSASVLARLGARLARRLEALTFSSRRVGLSTMPVTASPWLRWNRLTASAVALAVWQWRRARIVLTPLAMAVMLTGSALATLVGGFDPTSGVDVYDRLGRTNRPRRRNAYAQA